ncbi:acetyl-coenzyme A synthetase N-terminal domain-containing protein [Mycobacterium sp. URHB0021]
MRASIEDPATFRAHAAEAVSWIREPGQVLDESTPPA